MGLGTGNETKGKKSFGRKEEVLSHVQLRVSCAELVQWHPLPVPALLGQSDGECV